MIQDQFSHNIKTNIKFHNTSRILIENDDENPICISYDYIIKLKCIENRRRRKLTGKCALNGKFISLIFSRSYYHWKVNALVLKK